MPGTTGTGTRWRQINISFASVHLAEHHLSTDLGPALAAAEDTGLIEKWWFIRKRPWRLRYLPARTVEPECAETAIHSALRRLSDNGTAWFTSIYEPETHAFGGPAGMRAAHSLFHGDSRSIAVGPATSAAEPLGHAHRSGGRRELSLLLCTALMRAAGLDRYEQGDVWARVAAHRPLRTSVPKNLGAAVRALITVDTAPGAGLRDTGTLKWADEWFAAFEHTGRTLGRLAETGELTRGVRAVITHHCVFHWNRMGLSASDQAGLARAAEHASFADPRALAASSDHW